MVNIVLANARANVFETLYDSLTSSLSLGTVTAAYIDDTPTFPQVVINPASISIKKLSLDRTSKQYDGEIEISIYAKQNAQIDSISDEIHSDLNTNEATLKGFGLFLGDIEDSNEETVFYNQQKVHTKSIRITFQLNL
jgi:hypothetical protein